MDSAGITASSQKMLNMNSVPAKNSAEIFFWTLLSIPCCSERLPPHADVSGLSPPQSLFQGRGLLHLGLD